MSVREKIVIVIIVILMFILLPTPVAKAQIGFSAEELQRDMQNTASLVKAYYKSKKVLPTDSSSCDDLLYVLYKRSREYDPNQPLPYPTSEGMYRELGRFRVAYDQSINQVSNTLILWRRNPPESWSGKGGTVGVVSNGDKKFLLYGIGENGKPISSSNGLTVYDLYDCSTGAEDERIL